jgi:hypothetical protein
MVFKWLFGGVDESRDRELADKMIFGWEIDQTIITPLALKLDETRDAHEKAVFAVMIAWHIDSCYKDILGLFKRATATVPGDKINALLSARAMKQIGNRATKIHAQMEPYMAVLEDSEVGEIIAQLEQNKSA